MLQKQSHMSNFCVHSKVVIFLFNNRNVVLNKNIRYLKGENGRNDIEYIESFL
ncbi:MAG: hypothetical protein ACJAX4_004460 [Clostridium sp.]|jgi:hypothetical protein